MCPRIELHVEPGVEKSWQDFCRENPPKSIALDGYVNGPPAYDPSGPYANFDHHCGVNRLATRSTSGQVLVAILLGLFDSFCEDGQAFAHVFVNDCDQDVCMAYWLLTHADEVPNLNVEMEISQLVIIEDLMDSTAGAIPINPDRVNIRKQAWVFELYDHARNSGALARMNREEMQRLIEETVDRMSLLARGEGGERELCGSFDVLGGGAEWQMIREHGQYARTRLFAQGIRAFVAVRECSRGRYDYTVGRMSPFINFPLDQIFLALNRAEPATAGQDQWGGSDMIGGSPRRSGSRLTPTQVEQTIEAVMNVN
ncbi:hypothetical protein RMSM_06877 [Rhodopirellula maiorica SM1]|uniref:Uncharacterized protein n=1 Tax=Rhodopirellula maiorica SM1 TaxID=1265738 RepID=M5RQI0_9BACT|nr:hypothetical protein [Rhodopirellula maiorica]EMI16209.1 hypothetical protein RMSM_06877 [Rhodopirellula maiorica SM1]